MASPKSCGGMVEDHLMHTNEAKCWGVKPLLVKCVTVVGLTLFCWVSPEVRACGLDWGMPTNHFDGVDEQGHVSYWEKIGVVDCGDGLVLPLHINFNSKRDNGAPSPYLGQGWLLPLLESKFIQESEDRFVMIQPDGLANLFMRAEPNSTVLNGSAGWKAEINGKGITAWADCGWKLTFENGSIASMTTPKGRKLDWVYEGSKMTELREGNSTRLKVNYDTQGRVSALATAKGKQIFLTQDKRPRIQSIAGQNVIVGLNDSVSEITMADGAKHHYSFGKGMVADGLEREYKMSTEGDNNVSLRVSAPNGDLINGGDARERVFCWNAATKLVTQDGNWLYDVQPRGARMNAIIKRINGLKQTELWNYDSEKGSETVTDLTGATTTKFWFMSGNQTGKLRRITRLYQGHEEILFKAMYDQEGKTLRQEDDHNLIEAHYSEGKIVAVNRLGKGFMNVRSTQEGNNKRFTLQKDDKVFSALVDPQENILEFYQEEKK